MIHPTPADLVDFLHAALSPEDDARIHLHVERCTPCRDAYREEVAVGEELRRDARAEERELPALVKARIMQAVREERRVARFSGFFIRLRPLVAIPAAAAIVFAASLALPPKSSLPPPAGIDAQEYLDLHTEQSADNPLAEHSGPAALFGRISRDTRGSDILR